MLPLLCDHCEKETLEWLPDANDGEGGYICPSWRSYSDGVGCFRVITQQEFNERHCNRANEEAEDSDDESDCSFTPEDRKAENVAALMSGDLVVKRQPLLPKVLSVSDAVEAVRKPFKSPCPGSSGDKRLELLRRLHARKRFVPWGSTRELLSPITNILPVSLSLQPSPSDDIVSELPPGVEPLILWEPEDDDKSEGNCTPIVVDPHLVRFLRPHQREGVQFMFECVAGLRDFSKSNQQLAGCILADDMGLRKTLQSITLLWTLLKQGFNRFPIAKKVLIVTPTSLVATGNQKSKSGLQDK